MGKNECRIDRITWTQMRKINELVGCVGRFAVVNHWEDIENYIRHMVDQIVDVPDRDLSNEDIYRMVLILRCLASFVRKRPSAEYVELITAAAGDIIQLIQGDIVKKNQLVVTTFGLVKEAIQDVINSKIYTDEQITIAAEEYTARIVNDVFGAGKVTGNIGEYVDKFYEMDPETEDVLHNGTLVVDGMKILIEDTSSREEISENMGEYQINRARRTNRWATVEASVVENGRLSFIAIYEDGVKGKATWDVSYAWIVKKDSIPRIDTLMSREGGIYEVLPRPKMVAFLKDRIRSYRYFAFDPQKLEMQVGIEGDVIPLESYLTTEGVAWTPATHMIVGPQRNTVYQGSLSEVLVWLEGMSLSLYEVVPRGKKAVNARKFVKIHTDMYEVWGEEGTIVAAGNIGQILEWTKELLSFPGTESPAARYEGYSVSRSGTTDSTTLANFVEEWEVK